MDSPKVSVIVPVFNSEDLLGNCLESIENQSLKDIEIICVDDGSSDGSFDILKQFASKDSRFKIYQQENSGAGSARNKGIEESCGEYILFVDSDDYIESETCEMLYEQASRLDCDLILFNSMRHFSNDRNLALIHFKKNDEINYQIRVFDYEYFRDRIFDGEYGVIWNKLYKSSFIRDNNITFPKHKIYNDVEFHIKTTLLAKKISYVDGTFYHYNRSGHASLQTSFVKTSNAMVFFDVLYGLVDFLVEVDMFDEFRKEFVNFTIFELRNKLKSIDEDSKQEFFEKTKEFYYSLELSSDEVNSIPYEYFMHFIFVVNSKDYEEFIKNE
ncbi:MAG: glycosyltransferase family 2 protein [Methanobrevibacter sp.]|uniref:glycosyltransferase family 2 protein n=1 Tax=Methanobrevibacter sp. TaxID=66852 RepID=UPI0025D9B096|nr:glycosyltransferase family 2 protein [Methanobrevibacter sp.]MBR6994168.1 glycosyltransferase family 2 protein [Methanobrevibacter sp.]